MYRQQKSFRLNPRSMGVPVRIVEHSLYMVLFQSITIVSTLGTNLITELKNKKGKSGIIQVFMRKVFMTLKSSFRECSKFESSKGQ